MTSNIDTTPSVVHKFTIGEVDGYLIVSLDPSGNPSAVNIRIAKLGSTVSGLMDAVATLTTMLLQSGTPIQLISARLCGAKFEPMGWSGTPSIGFAHSLTDYVFRWLEMRFGKVEVADEQKEAA